MRSLSTGVSVAFFLFSSAHCCLAASYCLRFAWHAVARLVSRARMNDGTAIERMMPMIATTIMISTSVKPFFIMCLPDYNRMIFYKTQHICYAIFTILKKYWCVNKKNAMFSGFLQKTKETKGSFPFWENCPIDILSKLFCQDMMPCGVAGAE